MRPEALYFLIAVAVIVVIGVVRRLRRGPVDERRDHPFPYTPPGQYLFGAVLAGLSLVAAGIGRVAILGGRVVAKA